MPPQPEPSTLVEMLDRRARDRPDRVAFTFGERRHTYGSLREATVRAARRLAGRGVSPGDRVVLVLPNGPGFFAALFGTQRAGAVPVPVFPRSGVGRVRDIAALSGASAVVVPPDAPEATVAALEAGTGEDGPAVLRGAAGAADGPARPFPEPTPADTALIQYTSGSTGDPKGVVLSHAHLLTNARQMIAGMGITAEDVFVSWLPVQHDMGLVLMTLVPLLLAAPLVLLPSTLTDVRPWLRAIERHRGTFTAAPDFAWRLCLRTVRDPSLFELGSLRVALDAAEPVRAKTLRRFHETFGLSRVMVPGYGLAEATVGVSMQPPGTDPVVSERGLVALGRPFPGVRVEVVTDEPAPRPCQPGEVGEITVESPAVTSGYYRNPEATASLFLRPGVIRTGDLGYRDSDGNLFLVGRKKNVILQAGRNLAPQELEEAAEALPFVRRAAAVGVDRGRAEGEQAYVFAELRRRTPPEPERLHEMAVEVVARIHERLGLRPGRVLLLSPRSIPRTANGKVRHAALREAYLDGTLRREGRVVFPER